MLPEAPKIAYRFFRSKSQFMLFRMVCFFVVLLGKVSRGFEVNSDKFRQTMIDFAALVSIK